MDESRKTDLSEYTDCIFVIKIDRSRSSSQILGTFFSKTGFNINIGSSQISGTEIIYLSTNEDEETYNYDNNAIDIEPTGPTINVYFVKTDMNKLNASANEIYSVEISTGVNIEDKKNISGVTNIQVTDSFELPTSIDGNVIQQKSDEEVNIHANEIITNIQNTLNELTTMLKGGMQRGGTDEDKEDNFKKVIYKFKDFVNRFITDSIIFQINSLNATEIKTLFDTHTTINIDKETYQRNDIKKPLFDNIYSNVYVFNVNYKEYMIEDSSKLADYDHTTHHKATYYYILKPLENDVEHDTQIYHDITSLGPTDKIHIYQFANQFIKFYNEHYRALKSESYFNGIIDNIYIIISDIIERFNIDIVSDKTKKIINIKSIIKSFHEPSNQVFRKDLGIQLQNNAVDKIITYVKINNFEKDQYNKRFDILIKGTQGANIGKFQNAMSVSYNDHNFPYYIKNEKNELVLNKGIVKDNISITQKELTVNKYKNTYLFGNYTQIFEPNKPNNKIADEMDVITKQVELGKPVFMLGYGASGSGKTSSLIYYNKGKGQEKNGILIHLCNILGNRGYNKIEMTAKEYFTVTGKKPDGYCHGANTINDPIHCDTKKFTFIYNNGNFELNEDKDKEHESTHKYREKNSETKTFEKNANMGDVMIYLIDQDRFVKATTNNPQSSRSHSMIYLKLTNETSEKSEKSGYIIVGDYAGVENKFTCENASTIIDFLEKKRDCGNEDNTNCKPYYSEEIISTEGEPQIFDSFNGKENGIKVADNDIATSYKKTDTIQQMISNFVTNNPNCNEMLYNIFFSNLRKDSFYRKPNTLNGLEVVVYNVLRKDTSKLDNVLGLLAKMKQNITTTKKKFLVNEESNSSEINDAKIKEIINSFKPNYDLKYKLVKKFSKNPPELESNIQKILDSNESINNIQTIVKSNYRYLNVKIDNNTIDITYDPYKNDDLIKALYSAKAESLNVNDAILILKDIDGETAKNIKNIEPDYLQHLRDNIYSNITSLLDPVYNKNGTVSTGKYNTKKKSLHNAFINHCKSSIVETIEYIKNLNSLLKQANLFCINKKDPIIIIDYNGLIDRFNREKKGTNIKTDIEKNYFSILLQTNSRDINEIQKHIGDTLEIQDGIVKKIENFFSNEIQRRFTYGIQICNHRVDEGEFINESLRQIRENIKDIITVKSQDKVFNSPDYIDICLEQYCPTHADCFKTNPITDMTKLEIKSVLIKSIYEYIKGDKTYYSIEKFYKEILISIFCVFNISRQANNPPPVPYIDINDLKIDVATYKPKEENEENNKIKQNIIEHLKRLYYKLNNGKNFSNGRLDYGDETTFEQHQVSVILSSIPYNEIYNKTNEMFEEFDIETIKKFIETIDNNNAVSAIGTLEFVDQIAKYNTTKTICSSNKIGESNVARYKDAYRYKNLYPSNIIN